MSRSKRNLAWLPRSRRGTAGLAPAIAHGLARLGTLTLLASSFDCSGATRGGNSNASSLAAVTQRPLPNVPVDARGPETGAEPSLSADAGRSDASGSPAGGDAALANGASDSAGIIESEEPLDETPTRPKGQRYQPRGKCVNPQRHAAARVAQSIRGAKTDDFLDFVNIIGKADLDGDGTPDQMRSGGGANMTETYLIYVMRGGYGHFVGSIDVNASLSALEGYSNGLRSLGGFAGCQPACCEKLMWTELRYDGRQYRVEEQQLRRVNDCSSLP